MDSVRKKKQLREVRGAGGRISCSNPIKVVPRWKRRFSAFQNFQPIQNSLRCEGVRSIWKCVSNIFSTHFFQLKSLRKSWFSKTIRNFPIFEQFDFQLIFLMISMKKNPHQKIFFCWKRAWFEFSGKMRHFEKCKKIEVGRKDNKTYLYNKFNKLKILKSSWKKLF